MEHNDDLSKRKEIFGKPFRDLANLDEDERIQRIGEAAMSVANRLAVFVDDKPREKALRYKHKIEKRFPGLEVDIKRGPTAGVSTLFVSRRLDIANN